MHKSKNGGEIKAQEDKKQKKNSQMKNYTRKSIDNSKRKNFHQSWVSFNDSSTEYSQSIFRRSVFFLYVKL
jgi:hypothetical protein